MFYISKHVEEASSLKSRSKDGGGPHILVAIKFTSSSMIDQLTPKEVPKEVLGNLLKMIIIHECFFLKNIFYKYHATVLKKKAIYHN